MTASDPPWPADDPETSGRTEKLFLDSEPEGRKKTATRRLALDG